jgi:hypothetical protein
MKKLLIITGFLAILSGISSFGTYEPTMLIAQRGCCSHHQGVSHCDSNGNVICNDGTTSPSCTC